MPWGTDKVIARRAATLAGVLPQAPERALGAIASRSVDLWVMSEDLPDRKNRVTLTPDETIRVV